MYSVLGLFGHPKYMYSVLGLFGHPVEYAVTDNETAACLHPSHFLRNKGDTANFDLEKPNFC